MTTTASSLPNDTKAAEALDKANATINSMIAGSKDLTLTDLGELCKIYKSVKPLIETALPLIAGGSGLRREGRWCDHLSVESRRFGLPVVTA